MIRTQRPKRWTPCRLQARIEAMARIETFRAEHSFAVSKARFPPCTCPLLPFRCCEQISGASQWYAANEWSVLQLNYCGLQNNRPTDDKKISEDLFRGQKDAKRRYKYIYSAPERAAERSSYQIFRQKRASFCRLKRFSVVFFPG